MSGSSGSGAGSATGSYNLSTAEGTVLYSGSCRVPDGGSNSNTFSADLLIKTFLTNANYLKLYLKSASVHNADWTRSGYCSVSASARYK